MYLKFAYIHIFLLLSFSVFNCGAAQDAVETNIRQLREAKESLLKNPKDKKALSFILNQLSDSRGLYRSNAAAVLAEGGEELAASIGSETVPALSNLLNKGDDYDKRVAARALRSFGPYAAAALPVLKQSLLPSDRDVAWFSADAIGNIGPAAAAAVPDLLNAIKESTNSCEGYFSISCGSFIPAIGKIGPPARSAVPDLVRLLTHKDPYVRMRLAVALIRIDSVNQLAIQELERLLQDSDVEVRRRTLIALSECGSLAKPVAHLIVKAEKDSDEEVRRQAANVLRHLSN